MMRVGENGRLKVKGLKVVNLVVMTVEKAVERRTKRERVTLRSSS